ncbi:hypothetical protein [Gluconacetobacter dulcium]|uniref:hypothetical protein n=1 Tax=Gluconacetobacter dulcium TaxID=2729096 RepID=UPI0031B628CC
MKIGGCPEFLESRFAIAEDRVGSDLDLLRLTIDIGDRFGLEGRVRGGEGDHRQSRHAECGCEQELMTGHDLMPFRN